MQHESEIEGNKNQSLPIIYNKNSITFALDDNDFKDFVVSLLGKPEVIEGYIKGPLEIDFKVFQVISQQIDLIVCETNDAWLIEFVAELYFDDETSRRSVGIENFLASEKAIIPHSSIGFNFTWTYLLKFKSDKPPERQEISISSYSLDRKTGKKTGKRKRANSPYTLFLKSLFEDEIKDTPIIDYSVRSTIQNWGIAVSQRIKVVLEVNCSIEVPFRKLRLKYANWLSLCGSLMISGYAFSRIFFHNSLLKLSIFLRKKKYLFLIF
jgi:hypothetical protein